jgi:hypothetical protein
VYIKATPQPVWDAITKPEWTARYGYAPLVEYEERTGGRLRAHPNALLAGDGESTGTGGGWSEVLSGLTTLLETGVQLPFQSGPEGDERRS